MLRAKFVKVFFAGAAAFAAAAAVSVPAHAQAAPMAEFQVPFAFEAGGRAMPAGSYELIARSANVIALRNRNTGASILNASSGTLSQIPNSRLTFVKAGTSYWLESANLMGRSGQWRSSKPMSILVAGTDGPERVVLAARSVSNPW